ncbi:MAG: hypothetical protein IJR14_04795 [Synergistaceae bacterium]|nr:hypothetical protein [Synergistaceae bacterium]
MDALQMIRVETLDLDPDDFFEMRQRSPEDIAAFHVLPPVLGKSKGFGKIRVKLAAPRYEVRL